MVERKKLYLSGKQIRVFITPEAYHQLKETAKGCFMTLEQYAGLVLSGFTINKPKLEENKA